MKLTFYSNFINHHQIPLAEEFYGCLQGGYTFVAATPVSRGRLALGYQDQNHSLPYVLTTYDSADNARRAKQLVHDSDVVVVGSAPDSIMADRLPEGKLTFHASERYFKTGTGLRQLPRNFASAMKHIRRFQRYPDYYYLCMSAYTAADVNRYADFRGRCFQWGYFTEVKHQNLDALFARKRQNSKPLILWVGRMIPWKHPEAALALAAELKARDRDFRLDLIGTGPMEAELRDSINNQGLSDCVSLLGSMTPAEVREHMEQADIFLFTSEFNEGWGAVLNESMNSGCAVVASHAIGSVPYLMEDGENGLIYQNGDQDGLNRKVCDLLDHPEDRERLGRAACRTMEEQWNAPVAAERFLKLVEHIQSGNPGSPYATGPCSMAEILKNNWYKDGTV